MSKFIALSFAAIFSIVSLAAHACPKGEHPEGGEGPYHKGGWCAP